MGVCCWCPWMTAGFILALGVSHGHSETFILNNGDSFEGSIIQNPRNVAIIRLELGGMRPESFGDIREVRIKSKSGEVIAGELISWTEGTYTVRTHDGQIDIRDGVIIERTAPPEPSAEPPTEVAEHSSTYVLAANHPSSASYQFDIALTSLIKIKVLPQIGVDLSPAVVDDQVDGIKQLQQNQVQFAVVDALTGHFAYSGAGPFADSGPDNDLRAIAALWPDVAHFVLLQDYVRSGTIDDLTLLLGKQISLGDKDTAVMRANWALFANLGIDIDENFNLVFGDDATSAEALSQDEIIGMGVPGWPPRGSIAEVLETLGNSVRLLEFTDEQVERAGGGSGIWHRFTIPAGTYPGQNQDIATIAQPNILIVRSDVPQESVYQITKAIFDNLPWLREFNPAAKAITLDRALQGLPLPLHPGAERYYREIGVASPSPGSPGLDDRLSKAPL